MYLISLIQSIPVAPQSATKHYIATHSLLSGRMLSTMSYSMEYPFAQLGSAVPAMFPPNFLCNPIPLAGGVVWGAEKNLSLCNHCSAVTKTSLCYQRCFQHKSKTQSHTSYYRKNGLYPHQNQHRDKSASLPTSSPLVSSLSKHVCKVCCICSWSANHLINIIVVKKWRKVHTIFLIPQWKKFLSPFCRD